MKNERQSSMSRKEAVERLSEIIDIGWNDFLLNLDKNLMQTAVAKAISDMEKMESQEQELIRLRELSNYFNVEAIEQLVKANKECRKVACPKNVEKLLVDVNSIIVSYFNDAVNNRDQNHMCECKDSRIGEGRAASEKQNESPSEMSESVSSDLNKDPKILKLENWTEVSRGIYRYVLSANACYEIHIVCHPDNTNIMKAIANVYIVGHWTHIKENISQFTRETLAGSQTVEECMKVACNDYNQNVN